MGFYLSLTGSLASATETFTPLPIVTVTSTATPACVECNTASGTHWFDNIIISNGPLINAQDGYGLGPATWEAFSGVSTPLFIDDGPGVSLGGFVPRAATSRGEACLAFHAPDLKGSFQIKLCYSVYKGSLNREQGIIDINSHGLRIRIRAYGPTHADFGKLGVEYTDGSVLLGPVLLGSDWYSQGEYNDLLDEYDLGNIDKNGILDLDPGRRDLYILVDSCGRLLINGQMLGFAGPISSSSYKVVLGNLAEGGYAFDGFLDNIQVFNCEVPTATPTSTQTATPSSTPSETALPSRTLSWTNTTTVTETPTHTLTASTSATLRATQSGTSTATHSRSATPSASFSASQTASATFTPWPTDTPTPSPTATPMMVLPTLRPSPSPIFTPTGKGKLLSIVPAPSVARAGQNVRLYLRCSEAVSSVEIRCYSVNLALVGSMFTGMQPQGWSSVDVPLDWFVGHANGVYYLAARSPGQAQPQRGKLVFLK
jgi:hypothetical protein